MTCTLTKTLEALDSRLEKLNANLKASKEKARECLAAMKAVKRLVKDLKAGQSNTHSTPR